MKQEKLHVDHIRTDEEFWKGVDNSYKNLGRLAVVMSVIAFLLHYFN